MGKLYVANATRQTHQFLYWIAERKHPVEQTIPPGAQVLVAGRDLSPVEIDAIVAHHANYGMVRVGDANRGRAFSGLCYQLDKSIPVERIRALMLHNDAALRQRGREFRELAAVSINAEVERMSMEQGIPTFHDGMEVTVEEERGTRVASAGDAATRDLLERELAQTAPRFEEGIRITEAANPRQGERQTRVRGRGRNR